MQKLIRNHIWVSIPNSKNISYLGITDYAKDYFLRFHRIDYDRFFKVKYGMQMKNRISYFLERIRQKSEKNNNTMNLGTMLNTETSNKIEDIKYNDLCLSDQIQYDRFAIRRDQPFSQLHTVQFDVQLSAPVQLRILDINFEIYYDEKIYQADWIYKVEILDNNSIENKIGLMNEQQYMNSPKIIPYTGFQL